MRSRKGRGDDYAFPHDIAEQTQRPANDIPALVKTGATARIKIYGNMTC